MRSLNIIQRVERLKRRLTSFVDVARSEGNIYYVKEQIDHRNKNSQRISIDKTESEMSFRRIKKRKKGLNVMKSGSL
jgi:hypothetical protein